MLNRTIVFRARSNVEIDAVQMVLETRGIGSVLSSAPAHSIMGLAFSFRDEMQLSVNEADELRAKELIAEHANEATSAMVRTRDECGSLESRLGYKFRNIGLLKHALTHRSRAHEEVSIEVVDNESLEFLGDAVLGLVIADRLYREFQDYDEGQKSKIKAQLVSSPTLVRLGNDLRLGEYLLLGRGEEKTGGRHKSSLIADTFEAVVAAVYLDGGYAAAAGLIERQFRLDIDGVRRAGVSPIGTVDYKSELQEWLQGRGRALPKYRLGNSSGPDHAKLFIVDVVIGGRVLGSGEGRSKKGAEQQAAHDALNGLIYETKSEKSD